jgi:hypothetical protein
LSDRKALNDHKGLSARKGSNDRKGSNSLIGDNSDAQKVFALLIPQSREGLNRFATRPNLDELNDLLVDLKNIRNDVAPDRLLSRDLFKDRSRRRVFGSSKQDRNPLLLRDLLKDKGRPRVSSNRSSSSKLDRNVGDHLLRLNKSSKELNLIDQRLLLLLKVVEKEKARVNLSS